MGFRDFDDDQIHACLERERVIRIAFSHDGELYLVPVFYTWHEGALCGLTTPGRKTRLGAANPNVAFQVDSTADTGPWAWSSVTGQGTWEEVPNPGRLRTLRPETPRQALRQPRMGGPTPPGALREIRHDRLAHPPHRDVRPRPRARLAAAASPAAPPPASWGVTKKNPPLQLVP